MENADKLKRMAKRITSCYSPETFNLDKYAKQKEAPKTNADAWRRGDYKSLIKGEKDEGN